MEKINRKKSYLKWDFATKIALGSFAIGTVLFFTYKVIPKLDILFLIGLYYVLLAIMINTIMLLYLIFLCFILPEERENLALKIILILCNIPIAILFLYNIF